MKQDRWNTFLKREQLLFIGSEFERARVWQSEDQENFIRALEQALALIDLTVEDPKWKNNMLQLLTLRAEVAQFYTGENKKEVSLLYAAL